MLCKHYLCHQYGISVTEDADVPPRERFPAARSEEKRKKLAEKGKESLQSFQGHPLRISKPRIPDSRNNNLPDFGIWILLHGVLFGAGGNPFLARMTGSLR